ncbi:MAG: cytochrome P450 [Steroidobacteraceae bacterium]|jgi:cytochrome P450|nr:cytochrome P450 [Steroidobacteraceae bacterium]
MATVTLDRIPDALAALKNENLAQSLYDEGKVIMDGTLLVLHGEAHRARRMLEFRVFRRSFFRHYESQVFPRALAEVLGPVVARGGCDLVEFGYRITMNLTADFAGIDRLARTPQETEALLALVMTFSEGATLVHSTRDKEQVRAEVRAALAEFDRLFLQPSIARREALIASLARGEIEEEDLPRDVLTVLLRNEDRLELPPDLLRREIAFYLQAGSHSTANSTVHALHNIFQWMAAHPEDRERILGDPLFLQRCVHESLRLHPASPVAWRKPVCPVRLPTGAEVGTEDRVEVDLWTANRSRDVFGEDAELFNPHRVVAPGHEPFGLTFGTGVHTCLGRDLDGGLVARGAVDPATHAFGIITLLVKALLAAGAAPDPRDPPQRATYTARPNWGRYPVIFSGAIA